MPAAGLRNRLLDWRIALAPIVAGVLLLGLAPSAEADHTWGDSHWARKTASFNLLLGDNVSSGWDRYLVGASADWTASSVLDTTIVAGRTTGKQCRPTSGRVEVCNASYGRTNWLGIAQIWASGSHITQALVKLNDTYFNMAAYNTPAYRAYVPCQEVGHVFGLGHQDEGFTNPNLNTCMDYTNNPESNQHPNDHDYALLEQIYGHVDSTTTVGTASATTATKGQGNSAADWGKALGGTHHGRAHEYVRDLGNGQVVITHVFWADHHHDH